MTKAIILAAGRGSRMKELTDESPKCFVNIYGRTLLDITIRNFIKSGISKQNINIVVGYKSYMFEEKGLPLIKNEDWQKTNMVSSLLKADHLLRNFNCIVSYSDLLYSYKIINNLMSFNHDIVLAYDPFWYDLWSLRFSDPLIDAETFKHKSGFLTEIGNKTDNLSEINGQYMGVIYFKPQGWLKIQNILKDYDNVFINKLDITKLMQILIDKGVDIVVCPINEFWFEIDSANDLSLCLEMIKQKEFYV